MKKRFLRKVSTIFIASLIIFSAFGKLIFASEEISFTESSIFTVFTVEENPFPAISDTENVIMRATPTVVRDGVYEIKNPLTGRYIDTDDGKMPTDGMKLEQWDHSGARTQRWVFTQITSGQYTGYSTIQNAENGLYMTVKNNSDANDADVILSAFTGGSGQYWKFELTNALRCKIIPACGESKNRVLCVNNALFGSTINGLDIKSRTYTDDDNYKDEWNLGVIYHGLDVTLNVLYDHGYENKFSRNNYFVTRINSLISDLKNKYSTDFFVNISTLGPSIFTSYVDGCTIRESERCTHGVCQDGGEYHHTNIYNIIQRMPRPTNGVDFNMGFIGVITCSQNDDNAHQATTFGHNIAGLANQNDGIMVINAMVYELKTVVHEFGHMFGAPDHYGELNASNTANLQTKKPDYRFDRKCIYGEDDKDQDVIDNLTICEGCQRSIRQNIYRRLGLINY